MHAKTVNVTNKKQYSGYISIISGEIVSKLQKTSYLVKKIVKQLITVDYMLAKTHTQWKPLYVMGSFSKSNLYHVLPPTELITITRKLFISMVDLFAEIVLEMFCGQNAKGGQTCKL